MPRRRLPCGRLNFQRPLRGRRGAGNDHGGTAALGVGVILSHPDEEGSGGRGSVESDMTCPWPQLFFSPLVSAMYTPILNPQPPHT